MALTLRVWFPRFAIIIAINLACLPCFAQESTEPTRALRVYEPTQALVFDEVLGTTTSYAVAYERKGFLVDIGDETREIVCRESNFSLPTGAYPLGSEGREVILVSGFGDHFRRYYSGDPSPFPLPHVQDDCEFVFYFDDVEDYLGDTEASAASALGEMETCVEDIEATYCELLVLLDAIIPAETVIAPLNTLPSSTSMFDFKGSTLEFAEYAGCYPRFRERLDAFSIIANRIDQYLASCRDTVDGLNNIIQEIVDLVENEEHITQYDLDLYTQQGAGAVARQHKRLDSAEENYIDLVDLMGDFTLAAIEAACDECAALSAAAKSDPLIDVQTESLSAVIAKFQREPLGHLIGSIKSTAQHTEDTALADSLDELADRLIHTDSDRVLHVSFPGTLSVGTQLVAVQSQSSQDSHEPQVVVLSAYPKDAPFPKMNAADQLLLDEAIRLFVSILNTASEANTESEK